jgi:hypothetical protein
MLSVLIALAFASTLAPTSALGCLAMTSVHTYSGPAGIVIIQDGSHGYTATDAGIVIIQDGGHGVVVIEDGSHSLANLHGQGGGCDTDFPALAELGPGEVRLASESGDGASSGSLACLGIPGHHAGLGGHLVATDALGGAVGALVISDASVQPPLVGPDCGDGLVVPCGGNDVLASACTPGDHVQECLGSCNLLYPPGADGTYQVLILSVVDVGRTLQAPTTGTVTLG